LEVILKMRPKPPVAKEDGLGGKTCRVPVASSTATTPWQEVPSHDQIHHLELVEKGHLVLDALLVKGLQDHVTGAIGRIAGPRTGALPKLRVWPPKRRWSMRPSGCG
jgi:hypothetical protein